MKPNDALAFLLYAAGIGFCASVGSTAYRVDAHSVVVALIALAMLFAWLIARRWRSVALRQRSKRRQLRMYSNAAWPERPWSDTH